GGAAVAGAGGDAAGRRGRPAAPGPAGRRAGAGPARGGPDDGAAHRAGGTAGGGGDVVDGGGAADGPALAAGTDRRPVEGGARDERVQLLPVHPRRGKGRGTPGDAPGAGRGEVRPPRRGDR